MSAKLPRSLLVLGRVSDGCSSGDGPLMRGDELVVPVFVKAASVEENVHQRRGVETLVDVLG